MSDQAPPAAAPAQAAPQPYQGQPPEAKAGPGLTSQVVACATNAERELEKCATLLAHAGANQTVTRAVTQMAEGMRMILKAMHANPHEGQQPPAEHAPPQKHSMSSAANDLVAAVAAKKNANQGG